jgi:hypothetical protein
VGPFQLNIQCRSGEVRLIGIEYSVAIWIRWAHSDSIFNADRNWIFSSHTDRVGRLWLNIQCRSGQVRLIRIEYAVVMPIGWAHSTLNIQWSSRQVRLIGMDYWIVILIRWAFQLNIQWRSRQIRLIGIEYWVAILIRWAHSALNIQCKSGQVRVIGIEYSVVVLIRWAHSGSIFNAGLDRLA